MNEERPISVNKGLSVSVGSGTNRRQNFISVGMLLEMDETDHSRLFYKIFPEGSPSVFPKRFVLAMTTTFSLFNPRSLVVHIFQRSHHDRTDDQYHCDRELKNNEPVSIKRFAILFLKSFTPFNTSTGLNEVRGKADIIPQAIL